MHEWGTFTSVAAEDGTAVDWVPQQGPRDLPCFGDRVQYNLTRGNNGKSSAEELKKVG